MKIQKIENCSFKQDKQKNTFNRLYRGFTGMALTVGVCSLASDRLFKSPKKLPNKLSKFGFFATWTGIGLLVLAAAKKIYDKTMESKPEN